MKAALLHQGGKLGAEAAGARRLMHDHAAPGLLDGGDHRLDVERQQRAEIDDSASIPVSWAAASATCTMVP